MAEQKVLTYPVQANVEVFYDPDKPQIAVLEPGGKLVWYLFVLIRWFLRWCLQCWPGCFLKMQEK